MLRTVRQSAENRRAILCNLCGVFLGALAVDVAQNLCTQRGENGVPWEQEDWPHLIRQDGGIAASLALVRLEQGRFPKTRREYTRHACPQHLKRRVGLGHRALAAQSRLSIRLRDRRRSLGRKCLPNRQNRGTLSRDGALIWDYQVGVYKIR